MRADYKLPLPVLREYLGPSTLTEFESPNAEGAYHSAWRCGCIALYRKSAHDTAVWRPCALHRSNYGERADLDEAFTAEANAGGPERRSGTNFCIIDAELKVLCKSSGSQVGELMALARHDVRRAVAAGMPAVVAVDADTVLRIMPLDGDPTNAFAVVVEGRRARSRTRPSGGQPGE
jgi:hypothetical protein